MGDNHNYGDPFPFFRSMEYLENNINCGYRLIVWQEILGSYRKGQLAQLLHGL
jgi:hypothetical protein